MEQANTQSNANQDNRSAQKPSSKHRLLPFFAGLLVGAVLVGIIVWLAMPGMMLVKHQSRFATIEETCAQLQASIVANGWTSPPIRNMNRTMAKNGVVMARQVRIVELCNANYAKDILTTNPEVSTLMPCAWGVYKEEDGKVYISGMNMGLMGKMFGGNIARVMGGFVSKDEAAILKDVVQ